MRRRFLSIAALSMLLTVTVLVPVAFADDDGDDNGGGVATVVYTAPVLGACVPSSPTDQVCDPKSQVAFSGEADRVTFYVSPAHCSSISVQLFVNGVGQGESPFLFWAGEPNLPMSFTWNVDLDPGDVIELQATGRVGGCNTGFLSSWGGRVEIVDEAGDDDDDDNGGGGDDDDDNGDG